MTLLEREFYRSFRGPEVGDEDNWRLVFDPSTTTLRVRHSWRTRWHSGADDISLDEFVLQQSAARDALMAILFERAMADA
jgi:hypothetical protein